MNHIALEVGDIETALAFYGQIFDVRLRGKTEDAAFIDLGDQFIALMRGPVRAAPATGILAWSWTTARPCGRWQRTLVRHCWTDHISTSSIHGATASRSYNMPTFSSRRHPPF